MLADPNFNRQNPILDNAGLDNKFEPTKPEVLQFDGQGFWLATKRLSKGRFQWWPAGNEAARVLQAHQAQLLLAAGNPETEAAPVWRKVR